MINPIPQKTFQVPKSPKKQTHQTGVFLPPMTPKKQNGRGRGRPRKIPIPISTPIPTPVPSDSITQQEENNPNNVITIPKRGRGRPRKYPPRPQLKESGLNSNPPKLGQIPDLASLMKNPGMDSVWGTAPKGKRIPVKKGGKKGRQENREDLGFPSTEESDYSSSSTESNYNARIADSWFSDIVIPGPIPDLDALLRDPSIFRHSDFFSDIPDDWDFLPFD